MNAEAEKPRPEGRGAVTPASFHDGRVVLHAGDCLDVLAGLPEASVDAIVTDPPYHLTSIVERFGADGANPAQSAAQRRYAATGGGDRIPGTDQFGRLSTGFMGKVWDGGDIAFRPETWAAVLRVLKPGGHLVAFAATKNQHRMVCAIEDAGFEIRDRLLDLWSPSDLAARFLESLTPSQSETFARLIEAGDPLGDLAWLFGTGFPKSLDVSKAIDKAARGVPQGGSSPNHGKFKGGCSDENPGGRGFGAGPGQFMREPQIIPTGKPVKRMIPGANQNKDGWEKTNGREYQPGVYVPGTDDAARWSGWGTALKPAYEPICLARKPLVGTVAANVLTHGTGGLNIDATRIATDPNVDDPRLGGAGKWRTDKAAVNVYEGGYAGDDIASSPLGRWPANVLHDGSDEVVGMFPITTSGTGAVKKATCAGWQANAYGKESRPVGTPNVEYGDTGTAARFFASFPQQNEARCCLCDLLLGRSFDIHRSCDVSIAEPSSPTQNTRNAGTARSDVAASRLRESEDSPSLPIGLAPSAERSSEAILLTSGDIALQSAPSHPLSRIVQSAKSAAPLCDSCATVIAQSLVATRLGQDPASPLCPASISEHRRQILNQCLALYVAGRESTDTILTTASLKTLLGSVRHAIADSISLEGAGSAANTECVQPRLFYSSKANSDDRIGSKHPTVKPVDLMRWLVRLVCPPGGVVLDPFAGTGTTGEAALLEGFRAVLIEREAEYRADIARRMEHVYAPASARKITIAKAKGKTGGAGPLFDDDVAG